MPGTVANANKVPVWVVFNNTNLGYCGEGDVRVNVTSNWAEEKFHQTGEFLPDAFYTGSRVTVQCDFAETESIAMWKVAFGHGETQNDTSTPPLTRFVLGTTDSTVSRWGLGTKASAIAKELVLMPQVAYASATTDHEDNITVPLAWSRNVGEILYSMTNGCLLPVTFEGLFDPTKALGEGLLIRGKLTAGAGSWVSY